MPPPPAQSPGWYRDPWNDGFWRWWDGLVWSGHTSPADGTNPYATARATRKVTTRQPLLPAFLSPPVLAAAIPSVGLLGFATIAVPLSIPLGVVPLLIVAPVLWWMDRIEPEPWSERLHAFLWGAFVAGLISLFVNSTVATSTGSEALASLVSAPLIEESTKALAIVWAIRRHNVDGIMDGLVYAGWSALGFAVVEDISYFFSADGEDLLFETFVGRALLTPFIHPVFTAWTGLAIGIAIRTRKPLSTAWWGLALAIATHAAWNASVMLAESDDGAIVSIFATVVFAALFIGTIVAVVVLRRRDTLRLIALGPTIAQRYGLPAARVAELVDHRARRRSRRQVPKRSRSAFDLEAGAITRLGYLLDHTSAPSPSAEARLVSQLAAARNTDSTR